MELSELIDAIHAKYPDKHRSISQDAVICDGRVISGDSWAKTGTATTPSEPQYVALWQRWWGNICVFLWQAKMFIVPSIDYNIGYKRCRRTRNINVINDCLGVL